MDVNTWYVIADGGKARIMVLAGGELRTREHLGTSGLGGAVSKSDGEAHRQQQPKSDPHELAKAHFAKEIATYLNQAVRTKAVDEIVLAAPAHILHDIREHLDKAALPKLLKAVSKDLTNTPDHEMASHFA